MLGSGPIAINDQHKKIPEYCDNTNGTTKKNFEKSHLLPAESYPVCSRLPLLLQPSMFHPLAEPLLLPFVLFIFHNRSVVLD
jgi:hypothetical protein